MVLSLQQWLHFIRLSSLVSSLVGLGCSGSDFSGAPPKASVTQKLVENAKIEKPELCKNDFPWQCNDSKTSCYQTKRTPDAEKWECNYKDSTYSCLSNSYQRFPNLCKEHGWSCSQDKETKSYLKCRLDLMPTPSPDASSWDCEVNNGNDTTICKSLLPNDLGKNTIADTNANQPASVTPDDGSMLKATPSAISDPIKTCLAFDMTGTWSGTWNWANFAAGQRGTWRVEMKQSADRKLSGTLVVTESPCGRGEGMVSGAIGEDCTLEFDSDLNVGSVGTSNRSSCKFIWSGRINPVDTTKADGNWRASIFFGSWSGGREL